MMRLGSAILFASQLAIALARDSIVSVPGLGVLQGRPSVLSEAVDVFLGIPYAQPPVGDLRWRPPQPHGAWESPREATSFGNACFGLYPTPNASVSEDCLFLNVYTPSSYIVDQKRRPVMVYIHGGAYRSGASNNNQPDLLVARSNSSVVVVTLNYRLNVFGFLGSAHMRNRSEDGSVGNYGIQDQRLALAWVRNHISAFGGNGSDVTIFGESAGGNSVLNHLTQPASYKLYQRAIIESGAYNGEHTLAHAEMAYDTLLNETRCSDITCLLHLAGEEVRNAMKRISKLKAKDKQSWWAPVIDGVSLAAYPQEVIRRKAHNKVPVILGSNRDESALWTAEDPAHGGFPANATQELLDRVINTTLGALGKDGIKRLKEVYQPSSYEYPTHLGNYSQAWWTATRMATDGSGYGGLPAWHALGACTVRWTARLLLEAGTPVVFVYLFAHPSQELLPDVNVGSPVTGTGSGSPLVPHASELPYVFDLHHLLSQKDGEVDLARTISSYWLQFATAGSPNAPSLPHWPAYSLLDGRVQRLDVGSNGVHPQRHLREAACDFWDLHMTPNEASHGTNLLIV